MSGICGFFGARDLEDPAGALDRMISGLRGGAVGTPVRAALPLGRAGLGAQGPNPESVGHATAGQGTGRIAVVLYGKLFGRGQDGRSLTAAESAAQILRRYETDGLEFLAALRGEFCFAIWDGRAESLHVATDHFRTHSVVYAADATRLLFASRIGSILAADEAPAPDIDPHAVVDVVASSVIPSPRTILRSVAKLPPAHRLTYRAGRCDVVPYWDLTFLHPSTDSLDALTERLRGVLLESVAVRFRADRSEASAVGTFLSGGVDSSTITGLVGTLSAEPASSFSIGFAEQGYNELSYARLASRALGAKYWERSVTPSDVSTVLPKLLQAFDEPFGNASAVPTYYCARLAREHGIDVLYAGDGGDELFAGNQRYASRRVFDRYSAVPKWARRGLIEPATFAAAARMPGPFFARAKRYIERATAPPFDRITARELLRLHPVAELFRPEVIQSLGADFAPYADARAHYDQAPAATALDRELYLDLKMAISDNDIVKVTRMCEAAEVGVRFPFLDVDVAEFAATVPASLKMRGSRLRWFFKRAYADLLPPAVRSKKKHGFGLPIAIWLRTDPALREMVHDLLLGDGALAADYLKRSAIESLVRRHEEDSTPFYGTILWNVLILELYLRSHREATRR